MTDREELIKEVLNLEYSNGDPNGISYCDAELVVDYFIARGQSLIEAVEKPLKNVHEGFSHISYKEPDPRIREALRILEQAKKGKP